MMWSSRIADLSSVHQEDLHDELAVAIIRAETRGSYSRLTAAQEKASTSDVHVSIFPPSICYFSPEGRDWQFTHKANFL